MNNIVSGNKVQVGSASFYILVFNALNTYLYANDGPITENNTNTPAINMNTRVEFGYNLGSTTSTINSGTAIRINQLGDYLLITGTTPGIAVANIIPATTGYVGRKLYLEFANSNFTVNSTGNIRPKGGTFTSAANLVLALIFDGTNWVEI